MGDDLKPKDLIDLLLKRFDGTVMVDAWGETSVFYNPRMQLPRGVYFATVKEKDGDNDKASHLYRQHIFRFNLGLPKPFFLHEFGPPPSRPAKGTAIEGPWDFTALDVLTPHPVYGWMSWVSVLNPSPSIMMKMDKMIEAAFQKAKNAYEKRVAQDVSQLKKSDLPV